MSRRKREKSSTGLYHVMLRGINKNDLFLEDDDRGHFLQLLADKKAQDNFLLPAYCLMDNHVHLLIKEQNCELSHIMKRINVSYVGYFNRKYDRIGPLFQDRYRSEKIEDEAYLLAVARYIHQNPVKANIVAKPQFYQWSSYRDYIDSNENSTLVDTEMLLGMFCCRPGEVSQEFKDFMVTVEQRDFLDIEEKKDELRIGKDIWMHLTQTDWEVAEKVRFLKEQTELSARKLAVITGLGKNKILNILK